MPDELDPRDLPDDVQPDSLDDDVPFHLPFSDDATDAEPREEIHPTDLWDAANPADARNMPTMPVMREPGVPDPKKTLAGSGGLDPNPDFSAARPPSPAPTQNTLPHQVTSYVYQAPSPAPVYQQPPAASVIPPPPPPSQVSQQPVGPLRRHPAPRRRGCLGLSPTCLAITIGFFVFFCGGLTLVGLVGSAALGSQIEQQLQKRVAQVDSYQQFQSAFFYDRNGELLYEAFNEGRRTKVSLSDFPQTLVDATVAIEDQTFFSNPGIDVPATTRAILQYFGLASGSSGGSTITQQLVRTILFDPQYRAERSIQRKMEEIGLALVLTQRKTKQEILELYLNEIYYGNLAYGAEAAAQIFFGKSARDLTLGEAALLAGLPQAPAELDPLNPDPVVQDQVTARWRLVLDRMVATGKITADQRNEALRQGYILVSPDVTLLAPHFTVYAQQQLERMTADCGDPNSCPLAAYSAEDITRGGWRVYTTLDMTVNNLAQQAVRDQVARLTANNVSNGAVVVLKPITGEIIAMVGSLDYNNDAIDGRVNVAIALRQPGSTVKIFNYSAAMENGMTPGDVIWDTPTSIGIAGQPLYIPRNYDGAFHGPLAMRAALANSYNVPAVQTLRRYGVPYLLGLLQRLGVSTLGSDSGQYGLSLTLGGGEVSLIELTNGFAVYANGGLLLQPVAIRCVIDSEDRIIYQYENGCPGGTSTDRTISRAAYGRQVLDPRIAFIMTDILSDNAARTPAMGANSALNTGSIKAAVKTGTTTDVKDNWTVGYTRNVAVGVWVGNSRGEPMINSSGLTGAAPIWNAVINAIYASPDLLGRSFSVNGQLLPDQPTPPNGMSLREICDVRSLRDPATDCRRMTEWFLDSPAAIPDAEGNLIFPPPPAPTQQPQQTSGPQLNLVSPGVYQVLSFKLAPEIANLIQFPVIPGQQPPLPPSYCQVPVELSSMAAGALPLLFIAPPPVPEDAIPAEQYARNNGLAYLPTIACTAELLQSGPTYGPTITTAVISSPSPGQVLTGETPIIGTVQFTADQGKFYKVEVIGGPFGDWVTIGSTHTENVVNGQLENLYVPGLAPGNYRLRLVIVDHGGGFLQAPYEIPFAVAR